jgi:hypothetical protein
MSAELRSKGTNPLSDRPGLLYFRRSGEFAGGGQVGEFGIPQYVSVANLLSAEELWKRLRLREENIWNDLNGDQVLLMEYHSPTGERIRVDQVGYYEDADALLLGGTDGAGNECQIVASPVGLHIVFRIVEFTERQEPRRRVGFTAERRGQVEETEA